MPNIHYAWDKHWQFFLQLEFHHACSKKLALISIATTHTRHLNYSWRIECWLGHVLHKVFNKYVPSTINVSYHDFEQKDEML